LEGRKPTPADVERIEELGAERASGPRPRPKKRKKKKAEITGLSEKQKIGLLVGGGLLISFLLIGVVFLVLRRGDAVDSGSPGGGESGVVDSFPPPPRGAAEEPAPPLDTDEGPAPKASTPKAVWAVKPDPPTGGQKPLANAVGALSPEPSLLL